MDSQPEQKRSGIFQFVKEVVEFALIAAIIVIPIRIFVAQPFIVNGASMIPTFEDGEYLIVDELSYRFNEPERGEVIIFRFPYEPSKFFIKRIIGLPGEKIQITGNEVVIINEDNPDGINLSEPYVQDDKASDITVTLADDEYFVMGDNRAQSSDSRMWGPLPRNFIIGKAFLRLSPLNELSFLPGNYDY